MKGGAVAEWSMAQLVRENEWKPKNPKIASQSGQSSKQTDDIFIQVPLWLAAPLQLRALEADPRGLHSGRAD